MNSLHYRMIVIVLLFTPLFTSMVSPQKSITLDEKCIIDTKNQLEDNEIFFRNLKGIESDQKSHLYFLDGHFMHILKVNASNLKLEKTISSRGQGPSELAAPISFRIKKDRIFVFDLGFNGVKVFDLEGKILKEFKIPVYGFTFNTLISHQIDVSSTDEIFVRHIDEKSDSVISVFNMNGQKQRQLISLGIKKDQDMKQWFEKTNFEIMLDEDDNLIILYLQAALMKKFTPMGKMIWSKNLYTDFPKDLRRGNDTIVKRTSRNLTISNKPDFFSICSLEDGDFFVSAWNSGMIYNKSGNCIQVIRLKNEVWFGARIAYYKGKIFSENKIYDITKIRRRND